MCVLAAAQDPWHLTATSMDGYTGITLANGYTGLVTTPDPFKAKRIVLGGVYDIGSGYDAVNTGTEGPKATDIEVWLDGVKVTAEEGWSQSLDMKTASMTTSFSSCGASFCVTEYVLRDMPYCILKVVDVTPDTDMTMKVSSHVSCRKPVDEARWYKEVNDVGIAIPLSCYSSRTRHGRYEMASVTTFMGEEVRPAMEGSDDDPTMCFTADIKAGASFRFAVAGAICTSRDFGTPRNEAMRMVQVCCARGTDALVSSHVKEWERLWESDIIIEGDPQSQQDVRSALYHLYSFVGEDSRESPSPMGLSSNGYNRHVFWDSEIWMYPPLLMLNQKMAKSMVDYRIDRLSQARRRARMFGYAGAMFPWESDDTGEESCPIWALTGSLEHHITADVAIAAWNYYCVTGDREWLRTDGWNLISSVAEFLVSRVEHNSDGSFSIRHVSGADEYACDVDDNAFTNGAAKKALLGAVAAAKVLKVKADPQWQIVADGMAFHYFGDGVMMEHATYGGAVVKQADVNLLSYPLGLMTDRDETLKNLVYYEGKIDPHGPAMGNCILSAIYSRLGDRDNAWRLFKKCYEPHKCAPFGVLSEEAGGHNPYFATGAGGMLQAVLAGFGGLRITPKGIVQKDPCLPEGWTSLTITGVGPEKKTYSVRK